MLDLIDSMLDTLPSKGWWHNIILSRSGNQSKFCVLVLEVVVQLNHEQKEKGGYDLIFILFLSFRRSSIAQNSYLAAHHIDLHNACFSLYGVGNLEETCPLWSYCFVYFFFRMKALVTDGSVGLILTQQQFSLFHMTAKVLNSKI